MIELKHDGLMVSFPDVDPDASVTLGFQRTLRIPDDGHDYPLTPGLGSFPLGRVDDHADRVPAAWLGRGSVVLPMWHSEALWLNFHCRYVVSRKIEYPFAIKVATGTINAVTGDAWQPGLNRTPQDYVVAPWQLWLDGYSVGAGVIRQFVAMPPGADHPVDDQAIGEDEFGGLQIEVFPMRREAFERRFPAIRVRPAPDRRRLGSRAVAGVTPDASLGLGPGGRMRQEIFRDPFDVDDWDVEHASRCFVHLVGPAGWQRIVGSTPPSRPLSVREYVEAGCPGFECGSAEAGTLGRPEVPAGARRRASRGVEGRRTSAADRNGTATPPVITLRASLRRDRVREGTYN
jgi:hypothetical protein